MKVATCWIFLFALFAWDQGGSVVALTSCSIPSHFFSSCRTNAATTKVMLASEAANDDPSANTFSKKDNKAMAFLRQIGKVGGTAQQDFTNAVGVDEGVAGKKSSGMKKIKKHLDSFTSCVISGTIDDLTESFPFTSSGTQWLGVTDKIVGGVSSGSLTREELKGRSANVLRATVRQKEDYGFVQMTADLAKDPSVSSTVDASTYDGLEMNVLYDEGNEETGSFRVHMKNALCNRRFWSYRAEFELPKGSWTTVRLPFTDFHGHGDGIVDKKFDTSTLRRVGIVVTGNKVDATIALSSVGFYNNND